MRYLAAALLVLTAPLAPRAQTTTGTADVSGTWTAELNARNDGGRVYLQIQATPPEDARRADWSGGWNMGQTVPVEQLSGLPANDLHFTASNVHLELRREAGVLSLDGAFRDGRGAGLFTFAPRAAFVAEMKTAGYPEDLSVWRRFQLALHDVGPTYIRALKTEGYDRLTLDDIQRAKTHGVTVDYIKSLKAEGYKAASIDDIVRTRDHGVTADYVKAMRAAGFKDAAIEDLVRAKDHGVKPEYVQELRSKGVNPATLDAYVRLRDHGVTADYITDMKSIGLNGLTAEDLVRLHDHGVTPGFVNHVRAQGFKEDTADGLIRLKNRGLWR